MEKVVCDICGTSYPETEDCCPICGCTKEAGAELMAEDEDFLKDSPLSAAKKVDGKFVAAPQPDKKNEPEEEPYYDEDDDDEDEDAEDEQRENTGVVILLVILIMILLAIAGFLFIRFLLPNMVAKDIPETEAAEQIQTTQTPTTQPGIPCEQLIMVSGAALDLSREGEYKLINVIVKPADTTDKLEYVSADESVVTVNSEGRVTAIGEGETVITVRCGEQTIQCRVYVRYVEETVPPSEEEILPEETTAVTTPDESEETAPPTVEETQPQLKDVTLKLGRTDISMGVGLQFTIPLSCDLTYEEIEWSTGNTNIATVENGVITTHAKGTTILTAKYGEQTVTCWIRVKSY
ncbi:MAG: Ig-like domain-containing protein [Oscillospiraceae bacterium]|nr:Ig-like domain-containing protein [Oscillospiraceae bacterium]